MSQAVETVTRYLQAFYSGDFEAARAVVAPELSFEGPFVKAADRETFFRSAGPLAALVRGHRLLHQWADDGDVCSIFELRLESPAGRATVPMAEWHTVRDRRIVAARVLFDSAAFRAVVPAPATAQ